MNIIFNRETDALKDRIYKLAGRVEERLSLVIGQLLNPEEKTLADLISSDHEIDTEEVAIEEECLKILALHQPVARDLRLVVAVLKINNDLERVGDIIVNIADRVRRLSGRNPAGLVGTIDRMGTAARDMLRESISSFILLDTARAMNLIAKDAELDSMNVDLIESVQAEAVYRRQSPDDFAPLFLLHSISRDLERIGDHATNIAEDVIYLADGRIVRHGNGE